jgi:hypothetical protein
MDGFHDMGEEKIESKVGKKSASLGFSFPSRQFSLFVFLYLCHYHHHHLLHLPKTTTNRPASPPSTIVVQ